EIWTIGSTHPITWNTVNVAVVHLEYRTSPAGPWHPIADAAGTLGRWSWTVPDSATGDAEIRASDGWDGSPVSISAAFGIGEPALALAPNEPNPVVTRTLIRYALPQPADVALEVFAIDGRHVTVLARGQQAAGPHVASFTPHGIPSGVYFYRLDA